MVSNLSLQLLPEKAIDPLCRVVKGSSCKQNARVLIPSLSHGEEEGRASAFPPRVTRRVAARHQRTLRGAGCSLWCGAGWHLTPQWGLVGSRQRGLSVPPVMLWEGSWQTELVYFPEIRGTCEKRVLCLLLPWWVLKAAGEFWRQMVSSHGQL